MGYCTYRNFSLALQTYSPGPPGKRMAAVRPGEGPVSVRLEQGATVPRSKVSAPARFFKNLKNIEWSMQIFLDNQFIGLAKH